MAENTANQTTPAAAQPRDLAGFRYDSSKIDWKDFLTEGCYYKILDVNEAAHTADIIVKFDPGARCLFHRHVAATTTMVLEGTLHVFDQTANGVVEKIKPAGLFQAAPKTRSISKAAAMTGWWFTSACAAPTITSTTC